MSARVSIYGHKLGPTLKGYVEGLLAQPNADQFRVNEELTLLRANGALYVGTFNELVERQANGEAIKIDALLIAGAGMRDALEASIKMAKVAAEIDGMGKDKYSIHTVNDIVNQIVAFVETTFTGFDEHLALFRWYIENELRVPKVGVNGTLITPDADVQAMDDMIPYCPEEQEA